MNPITDCGSSRPRFAKTRCGGSRQFLLVHYAGDGTVGLVINRKTALPVSRVLPDLKGLSNDSQSAYEGGPVDTGVVQALLQLPAGPQDAIHLFGKLYLVSQKEQLEKALVTRKGSGELRIYLGYSGWGPGQLEHEVAEGDWYIFDGSEGVVFDSNPSSLWSRMVARTELRFARLQHLFDGRRVPAT